MAAHGRVQQVMAGEEEHMALDGALHEPRTRRRLILTAAGGGAAGLGGTLAAACAGSGTGTPSTGPQAANLKANLRFMFFHDQWKDAFDQVIRNFGQKYPNVTVDFETDPS